MYQALYRKYRPSSLTDVIGQKVIVKTLLNEINNNKISHAYLFSGPRGTGKTSIAKILGKTINCTNLEGIEPCNECVSCTQINSNQTIDIIEIDAASNNGVDEIRELKSKVNLVPSTSKYKVYIIDEVHMLTTGAFNALLKTLEEPPAHVIFILATTDPQKIPTTIISRCQRFDFKKINIDDIKEALSKIAKSENIDVNDGVLNQIARLSDGGLRDSINLLDQVVAYSDSNISIQDVFDVSGTISFEEIKDFVNDLLTNNIKSIFNKIDKYNRDGKIFSKLNEEIIYFMRNLILFKSAPDYLKEYDGNFNYYKDLSNKTNLENLVSVIQVFNDNIPLLKQNSNAKLIFELSTIKILKPNTNEKDNDDLNYKVEEKNDAENKVETKDTIKEESKNIVIEKEDEDNTNFDFEKFEQIKQIRINNALAGFNKTGLKEFIEKSQTLRTLLVNKKHGEMAKYLLDGEIKVYGNNQIIILFNDESLCDYVNDNLATAEQTFLKATETSVKLIAVNNQEWNQIKNEFNSKTKQYKYIEENIDIQKFAKAKEKSNDKMAAIFGNVIEYK